MYKKILSVCLLIFTIVVCASCTSRVSGLKAKYKDVKVGDQIQFGTYEQEETNEPIVWTVLEIKDGKALLISDKIIDCKSVTDERKAVTWDVCYLREWLNGEFIDKAFTKEEQQIIAEVEVINSPKSLYGTDCGSNTKDKVYILSPEECLAYFPDKDSRGCVATTYAANAGCWVAPDGVTAGLSHWWLRSSGKTNFYQTLVYAGGDILLNGLNVTDPDTGVRPVLWIEIK